MFRDSVSVCFVVPRLTGPHRQIFLCTPDGEETHNSTQFSIPLLPVNTATHRVSSNRVAEKETPPMTLSPLRKSSVVDDETLGIQKVTNKLVLNSSKDNSSLMLEYFSANILESFYCAFQCWDNFSISKICQSADRLRSLIMILLFRQWKVYVADFSNVTWKFASQCWSIEALWNFSTDRRLSSYSVHFLIHTFPQVWSWQKVLRV